MEGVMIRKIFAVFFCLSLACIVARADPNDQYARMARISYLDGIIGFQHAGETDWLPASINMPLQIGDRIYTGQDGRAEIEFDDGSAYRLAEGTDVEILTLSDDLTQIRVLVGLSTLSVNSGIPYEIDTPAAAFTTHQKGKYRFDVAESGDTDGIVRKGLLEASNNAFSQEIRSGELLHIVAGGESVGRISSYAERDEWDEWNDRRDANMVAYARNRYVPDNVYIGVSDLHTYGRWIDSPYGAAWLPLNVDVSWSPYSYGRWCYRPIWGWTWVSYEPWGWLPFHYGRWYYQTSFGWCWIPGAAISFNFWSPGLVRFYNGPDWISWCPLGPGDYYDVNNYYYRRTYIYQLNQIRLVQNRGPANLINRDAPRAFRTVKADQFVRVSYGSRGANGIERVPGVDNPWKNGKMVNDRLDVKPTAHSYSPAPDRPSAKPSHEVTRPVIVRSEPAMATDSGRNLVRITNRNAGSSREIRPNAENNPAGKASGSEPVVTRPTRTEKGASQNGEGREVTRPGNEIPNTTNQGSAQERNANRNTTRTYQAPQRQSTPSTSGEVKNGSTARESGENAAQPERNPDRRMNTPSGTEKPSTNKGSAPASKSKGVKSQTNGETSQQKTSSNFASPAASSSGTRSFESVTGARSSANASSESYAATGPTQSQSRSFTMPAREQPQTGTGSNQSRNESGIRMQNYPSPSQPSAGISSSSMREQGSAVRSQGGNSVSGNSRTSNSGVRAASKSTHSSKANDASAQGRH
jgi:hypothetical protein